MRRARAFQPGRDSVGVFCPSDSIDAFPRRLARGLAHLGTSLGSHVKLAPGALGRYGRLSGDIAGRTSDLEALLLDPDVGLILCATGGYSSLEVSMALDLDLLYAQPKPMVGFSDSTALLLDLHRRSGLVMFHGPSLLPNFGEAAPLSWQASDLARMVTHHDRIRTIDDPPAYSTAFQFWDRDDDDAPPRCVPPPRLGFGTRTVHGRLIGGNLDTLVCLAAAGRLPTCAGAIVFWEAAFCAYEKVRRDLIALDCAGVFDQAAGMIVGHPFRVDGGEAMVDLIRDLAGRWHLPTIFGLSIGHTSPIDTLPIGAVAALDPIALTLTILEDTVS